MFDCIIIGGGPAGATAAYHLAKAQRSVLLLEKESLPRYKPCGGGVSPVVAQWFDFDFTPVISSQVKKVKYTWKMGNPIEADLKSPEPMWMVRRDAFDNFILDKAKEQGATIQGNTEVTGIKLQGDRWQVSTSQGNFEGSYLIAADGANGPTAAWLGFKERKKYLAATLEIPASSDNGAKDTVQFEFGSVKNGSIWNFPKADGYSISAAILGNTKGKAKDLEKQLKNYAQKLGFDLSNSQYRDGIFCLWDQKQKQPFHKDRALLVGETAGLVDPLLGEGIRPAIFSGLKASEAISKALGGDAEALAQYSQIITEEWGTDLGLAQNLAGLFYKWTNIAYKVIAKKPGVINTIIKILLGQSRYSEVTEKAKKVLTNALIPGRG